MHAKKTLVLLVAVALLGWIVARQFGGEEDLGVLRPVPIVENVDWSRVDRIRIEHQPRALFLSLERDAAGYWYITDPIAAKARDWLVREIFDAMVQTRGRLAPQLARDAVGLEPPQATIDFFVDSADDGGSRTRVELGAPDLVEDVVHLYADGRLLRAPRRLLDLVERGVKEFRETRLLPTYASAAVIGYTRRGALEIGPSTDLVPEQPSGVYSSYGDGSRLDLGLVATLDGDVWRCTVPVRTRLASSNAELLFNATARLEAAGFIEGLGADAEAFGLADPAFTIELDTSSGIRHVLEFGCPPGSEALAVPRRTWVCRVDGDDHTYYELDGQIVQALCQPFENLVDPALFGVVRDQIVGLRAISSTGEVALERVHGKWMVRVDGYLRPADAGLVSDWLRDVDRVHFDALLAPGAVPAFEDPVRVEIRTADGDLRVAEFGETVEIADRDYRAVRREGELLCGICRTDHAELAAADPSSLLSLRLVGAQEPFTISVAATDDEGRTATWMRDARSGRWNIGDSVFEDRGFPPLVDRVRAPVAARWLEGDVEVPPDAPWVDVTILDVDDARTTYRVVDLGDRVLVLWSGLAAELAGRVLFDGLRERLADLADE